MIENFKSYRISIDYIFNFCGEKPWFMEFSAPEFFLELVLNW